MNKLQVMFSLANVATKAFCGPHAKRHLMQLSFIALLACLWCYIGSTTTITINIETRQKSVPAGTENSDAQVTSNGQEQPDSDFVGSDSSAADDSFQLKNLDTSRRVPCGANKCFFRLNTDPTIGYLVQPDVFRYDKQTSPDQLFRTLEVSWELAEQLRTKHDIKHFLLEPPNKVKINKKLAKQLNANIWSEARGVQYDEPRFPKGSTAFIQKVRLAPEPNLIIGCTSSKRAQFQRSVDVFLAQVIDKKAFARQFAGDMRLTRMLLKEEPCLFKDMQVLVDTEGRLFHLDFDRCFSSRDTHQKRTEKKSRVNHCLRTLYNVERHVEQLLSGKTEESSSSSSV